MNSLCDAPTPSKAECIALCLHMVSLTWIQNSAPCIRGHRSTKCNHFNERVMVPVRKPGRPLSTCPCPPGKPCACGGVKVAIPRKQKCVCGPDAGHDTNSTPTEHSPSETPTSPPRTSFRVSKSGSVSKPNGRKPSFDPSNLNRVDPMSVNLVIPAGTSLDASTIAMVPTSMVAQVSPTTLPTGFDTGVRFMPTAPGAFPPTQGLMYGTPLQYDMGLQYAQPHGLPLQTVKSEEAHAPIPLDHHMGAPMPPPPYVNAGKHSRSSSLNGQAVLLELGPSPMPKSNGTIPSPVGGSFSSGSKESNDLTGPSTDFENPFLPQYQAPVDLKHQSLETFPYPTIVYPDDYGSWNLPVNTEMWQQVASQPSATVDVSPSTTQTNGTSGGLGTTHECGCGEGCQCVGCLAHPFNEQMFQYVNNAYAETNGSRSGSASNCCGGDAAADVAQTQKQTPTQVVMAPESPPEAQTPSDGSAVSEEQLLSTMDYFFVNIPLRMGDPCGGNIHSCPCGDDCECIGCLVHNAPSVESE